MKWCLTRKTGAPSNTPSAVNPRSSAIPVTDRGAIQANLIGERREIFANGDLSGLDLVPHDAVVENGLTQTDQLANEGITALDSFRGAYAVDDPGWPTGKQKQLKRRKGHRRNNRFSTTNPPRIITKPFWNH